MPFVYQIWVVYGNLAHHFGLVGWGRFERLMRRWVNCYARNWEYCVSHCMFEKKVGA